jgi:DNA-binding NtrC family response regulator
LPISTAEGTVFGVFGHVARGDAPATAPPAVDAAALEELHRVRLEQAQRWTLGAVPAGGPAMRRVLDQASLAADSDVHLAILGAAGTGKQTLARIIHASSQRRLGPLLTLDCRALPPEQQREELLRVTHVTTEATERDETASGADAAALAGRGTLIVLGARQLAPDLQELLARLDGGPSPWRVVVTERDSLEVGLAAGQILESFFFLVTRLVITMPALADRLEDLGVWSTLFLERYHAELAQAHPARAVDANCLEQMRRYAWPGNLTELDAVLRSMARRSPRPILTARDLPKRIVRGSAMESEPSPAPDLPKLDQVLESVERRLIELALRRHKGNKSKAAEELGVSRPRLHRRAEQLGFVLGPLEENPDPPCK